MLEKGGSKPYLEALGKSNIDYVKKPKF